MVAPFLPGLAQVGVDEALEFGAVALAGFPFLGDLAPGEAEAEGGIEGVEVVAVDVLDAGALGAPFAGGQHGGFLALADLRPAGDAGIPGLEHLGDRVRVVRRGWRLAVVEMGPFEGLKVAAMGTGQLVAALVAALIHHLDARQALGGGSADHVGLGAGEGALPVFDQGQGVALPAHIPGEGVHLVQNHIGQVIRAQAVGGVGAGLDEAGAGAVLEEIAAVDAGALGGGDQGRQGRGLVNHLGQARVKGAVAQFQGGDDEEQVLVLQVGHDVAGPVEQGLGVVRRDHGPAAEVEMAGGVHGNAAHRHGRHRIDGHDLPALDDGGVPGGGRLLPGQLTGQLEDRQVRISDEAEAVMIAGMAWRAARKSTAWRQIVAGLETQAEE